MSLKDDLLRNRKVFELLTGPEGGGAASSAPLRKNPLTSDSFGEAHTAEPFEAPTETQSTNRQGFQRQTGTPQNAEIFSLKFGRRTIRETGMSLSPPELEDIAFPELQKTAASAPSDPLEGLYHRLESDARRASQLLVEEDY